MENKHDLVNSLISEYEHFEQTYAHGPAAIKEARKHSYTAWIKKGFPTKKNEDWKYTSVDFLTAHEFVPARSAGNAMPTDADLKKAELPGSTENFLVFVNGFYVPELSKITSRYKGLVVGGLAESMAKYSDVISEHYGKISSPENAFSLINTAIARDGAFIMIPEGKNISEPIHLIFFTNSAEGKVYSMAHNLVVVGECSSARIVESHYSLGPSESVTNVVTEVALAPFSHIDFCKFQNDGGKGYYIGETACRQAHASVFHDTQVTLKGKFTRNDVSGVHHDRLCETKLYGFYLLDDNSFVDNHTFVDHAKPNCTSDEIYKGILADKSQAVFNGKIVVRPDAQKTEAFQSNKNVLLSNDATVNTKPQLEIYADDVKCSHGATTGYLDKESMFYLRSRGISESQARALLLNAFSSNVIDKIQVPELRDAIKKSILERLNVEDIYFCDVL